MATETQVTVHCYVVSININELKLYYAQFV